MNDFQGLGLQEELATAVADLGFEKPTPIQEKAIPVLLSGTTDFVGLAQTGTGKTAAFGLPLLQLVDATEKFPQALILCPTRELCIQICNDIQLYKKNIPQLQAEPVYGGASIVMQMKALRKGAQIVVATPGRLIDLIERKAIHLEQVKYVVLDEADEMLNMGFRDDIDFVLKNTVNRESTWLFSATMPPQVRAISKNFMDTPKEITVGKMNTANANIAHQYFVVPNYARYETLKRIVDFNPGMYGIIFTRTKAEAQEVAEKLSREGYHIEPLHGDLSQQQRDKVMKRFRNRDIELLIATDVAARGIDVDSITHVINYELPDDIEVYTHRSGRTARAGKEGICISLCTTREIHRIRQLEKMVKAEFFRLDIPTGKDVCRKQFFHFMDRLNNTDISNRNYETYMPDLIEKFQHLSKEEILQRVASLEFNDLLKYYEFADDLNVKIERDRRHTEKGERRSRDFSKRDAGYVKLFINLGTRDGFYKASFLQFVLDESNLNKEVLGRIDMRDLNTWLEVEKHAAKTMIKSLNGKMFNGRSVRMNEANGEERRKGYDKKKVRNNG